LTIYKVLCLIFFCTLKSEVSLVEALLVRRDFMHVSKWIMMDPGPLASDRTPPRIQ
ncbi:hypothetical protein BGW80DRAFT_1308477, partial [Lactifluus volemus]